MRQAQSALLVPLIDRGGTQAPRNKHNKNSEPPAIPPRRGSNQTWLMLNCDGEESNVGYGGAYYTVVRSIDDVVNLKLSNPKPGTP